MSEPRPHQPDTANREVERRVFNADTERIRSTLHELGAVSLGTVEFKRAVLDVKPVDENKWIRVRTEGQKTTIAIKERTDDGAGDREVEVEVADFDKALELLEFLNGYVPRSIQESRREAYTLGDAEVTIDTWPLIDDFVEIEAGDHRMETLLAAAEALGIPADQLTDKSVEQFYKETLGIDIKSTPLRFKAE